MNIHQIERHCKVTEDARGIMKSDNRMSNGNIKHRIRCCRAEEGVTESVIEADCIETTMYLSRLSVKHVRPIYSFVTLHQDKLEYSVVRR